jgi:hypothetical protein
MSLKRRLAKLEGSGRLCLPEDCPGGPTCLLHYFEGQPVPEVPHDAARCRLCGGVHVRRIQYVIVHTRAQADAMMGELVRASGVMRQ